MENIRNHVDIKLVSSEKREKNLIAKPNYKLRTIFDETLTAVYMGITKNKIQ